jgi:hypothetical protein
MAASVLHWCVFCESGSRRLHMPELGGYVIDCRRCGSYKISSGFDRRDRRTLKRLRKRIKPANARGMRLDVETLVEVPLIEPPVFALGAPRR